MRDPRTGLTWSRGRISKRAEYAAWMASGAWQARRRQWLHSWIADHPGQRLTCLACAAGWALGHGDLHHRSYDRLGTETDRDLVPLCRACHDRLHRIMESNPAWNRLGRPQATDIIVARLRQANQANQATRAETEERQ